MHGTLRVGPQRSSSSAAQRSGRIGAQPGQRRIAHAAKRQVAARMMSDASSADGMSFPHLEMLWQVADEPSDYAAAFSSRWTVTAQPGLALETVDHKVLARMDVHVLLFGLGDAERAGAPQEGVYSLRALDEDGLPFETVIVFECEEDALRYAALLEANMDHTPSVCTLPALELVRFCQDAGHKCRLEPQGSLLIPPDLSVGVTDWERAMWLRQGRFAVLDSEPERGPRPTGAAAGHTASAAAHLHNATGNVLARYHPPCSSDDERAGLLGMLASLLPPSGSDSVDEVHRAAASSSRRGESM